MSNRIDSNTPSQAEYYKTEIQKIYFRLKEINQDVKTRQGEYFGKMSALSLTAIKVYQGLLTRNDFRLGYNDLVDNYKQLWSLMVQRSDLLLTLDKLKEERRQYYEQLGEQSD